MKTVASQGHVKKQLVLLSDHRCEDRKMTKGSTFLKFLGNVLLDSAIAGRCMLVGVQSAKERFNERV